VLDVEEEKGAAPCPSILSRLEEWQEGSRLSDRHGDVASGFDFKGCPGRAGLVSHSRDCGLTVVGNTLSLLLKRVTSGV
jgi:hypothetical protein